VPDAAKLGGMQTQHFDVLIVGAGLSGIGAACFLQKLCPGKTFAIVEMRAASGGTWDLFRYPGIRSDSDMYTLGYSFRPWMQDRAIVDGAAILDYIRATARDHDVERHIRYSQRVVRAEWSSADALWTIDVRSGDGARGTYTCRFLHMCSGYYDYAKGHAPTFPRSTGQRTSTTRARRSWSSVAARPP
jgi:monooxygenase